MKKLKLLIALTASFGLIVIGQRNQSGQKDDRTEREQVQDASAEAESWFI